MKKKRKNIGSAGVIFVAVGIGIVAVCLFPTKWMLVFVAVLLVLAGLMLIKC